MTEIEAREQERDEEFREGLRRAREALGAAEDREAETETVDG